MLNRIPQLYMLVTSRKGLGVLQNCIQPEIQFLNHLKAEKDVELFVSNSAPIYPRDIYQLILEDPKYDITKVFPEIKDVKKLE